MKYDLTTIENSKEVLSLSGVLTELDAQATALVIKSNADEVTAIDMTKQVTEIKKKIDAQRKEYTKPANDFVKKVNGLLMPSVKKADAISQVVRSKMSKYRMAMEAKMKPETVVETKTKHTPEAKVTYAKVWTSEIIDEKKIPREYLQVNSAAIGRAVRNGIRNIEGVNIFEISVPKIG